MSSNHPELVAFWGCLEAHPDHENLLYLTDSESTLQAINKWIGGGAKLSLAKTADADILKVIVEKKKNPWLLGKMFESRFPHASGREEG